MKNSSTFTIPKVSKEFRHSEKGMFRINKYPKINLIIYFTTSTSQTPLCVQNHSLQHSGEQFGLFLRWDSPTTTFIFLSSGLSEYMMLCQPLISVFTDQQLIWGRLFLNKAPMSHAKLKSYSKHIGQTRFTRSFPLDIKTKKWLVLTATDMTPTNELISKFHGHPGGNCAKKQLPNMCSLLCFCQLNLCLQIYHSGYLTLLMWAVIKTIVTFHDTGWFLGDPYIKASYHAYIIWLCHL